MTRTNERISQTYKTSLKKDPQRKDPKHLDACIYAFHQLKYKMFEAELESLENTIDSRIIPDWQKTNCQTIIVNLPDELKDWKDFHVELFLKAICTGVSKKKR